MSTHEKWQNPDDDSIRNILTSSKHIAVVGCSPKPDRTSHQITKFLIEHGYQVYPIHPQADTILKQKVYKSLAEVPVDVDIVNVFRKPEFTPPIAESACQIGAKTLWLQQGIINEDTWLIAHNQGLNCVMDRCIAVMHRLLIH